MKTIKYEANAMFNANEIKESKRIEKKAEKAFRNARKNKRYTWMNMGGV